MIKGNNNEDKTYNNEDIMKMLKCEESNLPDDIKENMMSLKC